MERQGVCVYSRNEEYVLSSRDRIPVTSRYGCTAPARRRDDPAHPVCKLHSRRSLRCTPATLLVRQLLQIALQLLPRAFKYVFVKIDIIGIHLATLALLCQALLLCNAYQFVQVREPELDNLLGCLCAVLLLQVEVIVV